MLASTGARRGPITRRAAPVVAAEKQILLDCGDGVRLEAGDVAEVSFEGFGRPLTNTIAVDETMSSAVRVEPMT